MHYGVIQLLTDISGGEMLRVFREETCSRTSLAVALTRLPLDHQFSEAVDINETSFVYRKNYII